MPLHPYLLFDSQNREPADEWNRLGIAAHQGNNLGQAQQYYSRALQLDPRHALACQNLACLFAQSNLLTEAMLAIERAAMCDGQFSCIQANWAIMAHELERTDEALEAA